MCLDGESLFEVRSLYWFRCWPRISGGAAGQCHCVDGEDDVGVDAVNLDFFE